MRASDIIVIGGGIVGLTTALAFADEGNSVCLLERNGLAEEASWAGAGILLPVYPWRYSGAVQRMAQRGRELHASLAKRIQTETGLDSGYRVSGLRLFDELEPARAWAQATGERLLTEQRFEGVLLPDIAQTRNPRLCAGLVALLKQNAKVSIRRGDSVDRLESHQSGVWAQTLSGRRYEASMCVICAGAWASELMPELEIRPVKGQMLMLADEPGRWPHIVFSGGRYLVPRDDGLLLIGSTVEEAGFDKQTDDTTMDELRCSFSTHYPALNTLPEVARWSGLRPATVDGMPRVSPVPGRPGIFVNAGHFRNGLTMAPAAAELLLNITGSASAPKLDARDYALGDRVTNNR